jgi:hypothetical protein
MLLGEPAAKVMAKPFCEAGVENTFTMPMSQITVLYAEVRAFFIVAKRLKLLRQDVRRAMLSVVR